MYRDNSLIPAEAVRLAALGNLAQRPMTYAALASEARHFAGRIVGPSLDLLGPSLELLRVEGLVEAENGAGEDAVMHITEAGRRELRRLLASGLGGTLGGLNKLIIALKLRFLHFLDRDEQRLQAELLAEVCERELVRLTDLRGHHAGEAGHLVDWLDHDIAQIEARLAWFREFEARL